MIGKLEVGQNFVGMYPTHGKLNVLRHVIGEIVKVGTGPNGDFITVQESEEKIRCLSVKKIVKF